MSSSSLLHFCIPIIMKYYVAMKKRLVIMFMWNDYPWCIDDLKSRLENIIYGKHTHFHTGTEDYTPLEDCPPTLYYSILLFFPLYNKHELFLYFPFQNKLKHPLPHTGRESQVKDRVSALPYSAINLARICNSLWPEIPCWAGIDSSWMPLNADHARMKIQNLKRADTLCNYIKPYLQ